MAESHRLSKDALSQIAEGLATLAPIVFGPGVATVEIAESFPIWEIDQRVTSPLASLNTLAQFDERYHHQILLDGTPIGVAHSRHLREPNEWRVVRLARTMLASYIDTALDIIDAAEPDPTPVRLLKASPYRISALWLANEKNERVYVVSRPPYRRDIQLREFLTPADFVRSLAQERAFVQRDRRARQQSPGPDRDEPVDL
jgi:hypothetical protein